jgi:hypothetical protein
MKKALVALALAGFASTALANVAGGAHDLSSTGPNPGLGGTLSACQYCHAPHNVNTGVPGAPLWNRNTVVIGAGTPWTMYSSATLTGYRAATPNANSMTCLSCHDGISDMGATYATAQGFGGTTRAMTAIAGTTAIVGRDLTNDHPVSVVYAGDGVNYSFVNAITPAFRLYRYAGLDYVECATCHEPHTQQTAGTPLYPFLRVSKAVMCTRCHLK